MLLYFVFEILQLYFGQFFSWKVNLSMKNLFGAVFCFKFAVSLIPRLSCDKQDVNYFPGEMYIFVTFDPKIIRFLYFVPNFDIVSLLL